MISNEHYAITAQNIARHEWMGLTVRVDHSTHAPRVQSQGVVVDETKNTLVVQTAKGRTIVPKAESVFAFDLGGEWVQVAGAHACVAAPERLRRSAQTSNRKGFS